MADNSTCLWPLSLNLRMRERQQKLERSFFQRSQLDLDKQTTRSGNNRKTSNVTNLSTTSNKVFRSKSQSTSLGRKLLRATMTQERNEDKRSSRQENNLIAESWLLFNHYHHYNTDYITKPRVRSLMNDPGASLLEAPSCTMKKMTTPRYIKLINNSKYQNPQPNENNIIKQFMLITLVSLLIGALNDQFSVINCQSTTTNQGCPYPPVENNCQVNIIAQAPAVPLISTDFVADEYASLKVDTQASYKCDPGFELIGREISTCLASGKWSSSPPSCVTNIAIGKPTNQSSTVKGGDSRNGNDGKLITQHDSKYCTETRVDQSPWWQIDLLHNYEIRSVRLIGRACCNQQLILRDLEIRIGNSSTLQGNRLCAWHPDQLDEGVSRDFQCAHPIIGRFVTIQMVGVEAALSLCEVMVFSTQEFPPDWCGVQSTLAPSNKQQVITTTTSATTTSSSVNANSQLSQTENPLLVFNRTCYEMQTSNGGSFLVADTYCKARGGSLLHSVNNLTQSFITQELDRVKSRIKSKMVWLGAKRDNNNPFSQSGTILPGSTSALVDPGEMESGIFRHSFRLVRTERSSDNVDAIDEFPSTNLFSGDGNLMWASESSPIFNPDALGRTSLYQLSPGAGGSMSRGSQTFGLQISSTPSSALNNRTNHEASHHRSLIISQPNQLASYFSPPISIPGGSSSPNPSQSSITGVQSSVISSTSSSSSSNSFPIPSNTNNLHITSLTAGSHIHRSLRPPSLVSTPTPSIPYVSPSSTQINWAQPQTSNSLSSGSRDQIVGVQQQQQQQQQQQSIATNGAQANWRWVGDLRSDTLMSPVMSFMWAEHQPNNYNNQQDCVALDGDKKWLWNDVTCELDNLPWVCQYRPSRCGSPARHMNSTIIELSVAGGVNDLESIFQYGKTITYACPVGHRLEGGSRQRRCLYDGTWSGKAPRCQYVDCGSISSQTIENGRIIYLNQSQTTFGSQIKYVCYEDYVLVGNDMRQCGLDGKWTGKQPYCAYKWCPMLQQIPNGFLNVSSYSENSIASYQCNSGYKLVGNDTRQCLLGGKWTNQEPFCQYVDCGQPKQIANGSYQLINKTTNYLSIATYGCNENYTLVTNANNKLICSDSNRWTGKEPQCSLIDCGPPLANPGSSFVGNQFVIHSIVDYKCDPGFKEVSGSTQRTCKSDGQWSGLALTCKYVDCGRVPAILKGEVSYINGTTYLSSQVTYECTPGNRLSGHRVRFCGPDGRWTGTSPKCEEVRCEAPDLPANGSAIYIGNDRSFKEQSFSVGVTVQYECDYGHVVKGSWSSRLCQANGEWSGEAPVCQFVDCGTPNGIENGNYLLKLRSSSQASSSNGANNPATSSSTILDTNNRGKSDNNNIANSNQLTYFGTIAHYQCDQNFKLIGPSQRECLESGQWRQPLPTCEPVQCPKPDFFDEYTQVSLLPRAVSSEGAEQQQPAPTSHTRSAPINSVRLISNNQWITSNNQEQHTFGVGDKLYYSCIPGYELYGGPEFRSCTQYGQWSGSSTPRCRLIDCARPAPIGQEGRFYLLNDSTTFNSIVEYSCVRPFKLIEVKVRQAGNLIETLQHAQAGVGQILTSLPIGVKVCANNGQWMPNDQQPKCVSANSAIGDGTRVIDGDNSLDGSQRDTNLQHNNNQHNSITNGVTTIYNSATNPNEPSNDLNAIDSTANNQLQHHHHHHQSSNQSTSLWAKVVIAICLMVMFGLIMLTLICIRSGKKSTKQTGAGGGGHHHHRAILSASTTANGIHGQAPGPMHSIQLAPNHANGAPATLITSAQAKLHQQQQQKQVATLMASNGYLTTTGATTTHKIFPGDVMMTPQGGGVNNLHPHHIVAATNNNAILHNKSALSHSHYGEIVGINNNHNHQAETIMMGAPMAMMTNGVVNGGQTLTGRSIVAMAEHLNMMQNNGKTLNMQASDHHGMAMSIMDQYSRLSLDSANDTSSSHNSGQLINGGGSSAKTIRHNPNGLVTFVSPAQQQQQQHHHLNHHQLNQHHPSAGPAGASKGKIPTSVDSSQVGSSSSNSSASSTGHQNHSSPQSVSTSLSVSSSSSPSSSSHSSSAHHTTATRLSTTNSPCSSTASRCSHNLHSKPTTNNNKSHIDHSPSTNNENYQSPQVCYGGQLAVGPNQQHLGQMLHQQASPPSLPANPPPPHRLQQHQKQMVVVKGPVPHNGTTRQQNNNNNNNNNQKTITHDQSSVDIVSSSGTQSNHYMEPGAV